MGIINLGKPIHSKTITIEELPENNGYVILGTPQLNRNELYEFIRVCKHEINHRDKKINEYAKAKKGETS